MANRPDLNGQLWTKPDNTEPWFLIDRGQRRGIPSQAVLNKFLVNVGQLIASNDVDQIDRGADYPVDIGLVECIENGAVFLREGNVLRGIPSDEVFEDYNFNRAAIVKWPLAQILTHPGGPQIDPSTLTDAQRLQAFQQCWDHRTDNPSPHAKAFIIDVLTDDPVAAVVDWVAMVADGPDTGTGSNCFMLLTAAQQQTVRTALLLQEQQHNVHTPQ